MAYLSLSDVDALVLDCRDSKARSYIVEAVACLKSGAFRSAIVATWIAVVHDMRVKLEELANSGDKNAQTKIDDFRRNVVSHDVAASQKFEREILKIAREEFELLGPMEYVDLQRLQEDRNRCAHPSMLDEGTDWQPAPELARLHIVNAVTYVLMQAPVQGKAALERLEADLRQTYYPTELEDVIKLHRHGPLARPRDALVRNFVVLLLKGHFQPATFTVRNWHGRVLQTLRAVIELHREVAIRALEERLDELVRKTDKLSAAVTLCHSVPEAWSALKDPQRERLQRYIVSMPRADIVDCLELAWEFAPLRAQALARARKATGEDWSSLSDCFVFGAPPEVLKIAVQRMCDAGTFNAANAPGALVLASVDDLSPEVIRQLFEAAAANSQLRHANRFLELVEALGKKDKAGTQSMLANAGIDDFAWSDAG
jgi:hypothetical protein